jgi:hypothetical protein
MLRHKAMIQCARIAFGYAGIYDQDEAERIAEVKTVDPVTGEIIAAPSFDLPAALKDVESATTVEAVTAAWTKHVELAQKAKDMTGYKALKDAVATKGAALKKPPVQDVESRPVEEVAE